MEIILSIIILLLSIGLFVAVKLLISEKLKSKWYYREWREFEAKYYKELINNQ